MLMFLFFTGIATVAYVAGWHAFKRWGWTEAHWHGLHAHLCPECQCYWTHDDRDLPAGRFEEAMEESHACPRCQTMVFDIEKFLEEPA